MGGQCAVHEWRQAKDLPLIYHCLWCGRAKSLPEIANREMIEFIFRWVVSQKT